MTNPSQSNVLSNIVGHSFLLLMLAVLLGAGGLVAYAFHDAQDSMKIAEAPHGGIALPPVPVSACYSTCGLACGELFTDQVCPTIMILDADMIRGPARRLPDRQRQDVPITMHLQTSAVLKDLALLTWRRCFCTRSTVSAGFRTLR